VNSLRGKAVRYYLVDPTSLSEVLMSHWARICLFCVSDGVPKRSFAVALIVGTILNLINQGDALLGNGQIHAVKMILTFAVPYCVATYGAVSYRIRAELKQADIAGNESSQVTRLRR
jgi:hypothetical protein